MKSVVLCVILVMLVVSAPLYASDIDFGATARAAGMGGAGLALGDDAGTCAVTNPAAPAVSGAKLRLLVPGLDFHVRGTTVGKLIDAASNVQNLNGGGALDLVNDFAKQPTSVALSSVVGFAGQFGITVEGEASASLNPGPAVQEWANIGQGFRTGIMNLSAAYPFAADTNLRATVERAKAGDFAGADAAFAAYTTDLSQNFVSGSLVTALPAVQLSTPLKSQTGKWFVGTNLKWMRIESRNWQIEAAGNGANPVAVDGAGNVIASATFDAVEGPTVRHNSLKADVGAIYVPDNSIFQYGMVVDNLISPKSAGIGLNQADTMISVGVGVHPVPKLVLAADLINLTHANGERADLRMGAEYRLFGGFAVRAGYTGQGIAWGVDLFGLNLAFAPKSPRLLTEILRF